MSVSNINNVTSLLKKAYGTENSPATVNDLKKEKETVKKAATETSQPSSSTTVTLGSSSKPTPTYTAQGLLRQIQQYQLDNTSLLFGTEEEENDAMGLTDLMGTGGNSEIESMSQDWSNTIANDPTKAAVMVQNSKSESINTIFSGN